MNKNLAQLLGSYIADLYPQIQELPMRVEKKTAEMFNFNRRAKLDVLFGPDIESLLWEKDELISQYRADPNTLTFLGRMKSDCADVFFKSSNGDFDDDKIEVRLSPRDPIKIIDSFNHVKMSFKDNSDKLNLRADFAITQHWHMSLNQQGMLPWSKGRELLGEGRNTPLTFAVLSSFLKVQQEVPALFVSPQRLEDVEMDEHCVVSHIGEDYESVRVCRHKFVKNNLYTVEPRFGVNDAPQSVALYLSALNWGMTTYADHLSAKEKALGDVKRVLRRRANTDDFPYEDGIELPKGKGAFLSLLEKTVQSEKIHEMMPSSVFNALVVESADRYRAFLEMPPAQDLYEDAERLNLQNQCDKIALDHT